MRRLMHWMMMMMMMMMTAVEVTSGDSGLVWHAGNSLNVHTVVLYARHSVIQIFTYT